VELTTISLSYSLQVSAPIGYGIWPGGRSFLMYYSCDILSTAELLAV
jgi:hypothetical protein